MIRIIVIDTPYAIVRTLLGKSVINLPAIIVLFFQDRLVTNSNGDPAEVQTCCRPPSKIGRSEAILLRFDDLEGSENQTIDTTTKIQ